MDDNHAQRDGQTREQLAMQEAQRWQRRLAEWQLGPSDVARLRDSIAPRVLTPSLWAGEPLHVFVVARAAFVVVDDRSRGGA